MEVVKPAVAVVVAVYNVKNYLHKCIESVLRQTLTNIEVILVNDGSTDGCEHICEAYAKTDNRVKVIHQENGGLYSARNNGLKLATAHYLYFIDGDDSLELNLLEDVYNFGQTENTDVILFGHFKKMRLTSGLTNIIPTLPPEVYFQTNDSILVNMSLLFQAGCGFAVWEQLIKTSCVTDNHVEFPAYRRGTDMGFLLELYSHIDSLKSIRKAYYHYNAFNAVNKFNPKLIENHVLLFQKYIQVFQQNRPFQFYTVQLFVLWFAHVIPTNIVSSQLSSAEKMSLLKSFLNNKMVSIWLKEYTPAQANGVIAKTLLLALKSGSPYLIYIITYCKIFLKNSIAINYKKWFYKS
jgi:glycosyltransferase involved in cell wall biosynthesis